MSQELQIWVKFMARMIEKYGTLDSEDGGDGDGGSEQEAS